ncbi:RDD family protein [Kitasatospora sp. NPDC051170]|uniref:RDD family protein n=1 Tax=Kitasatospora sp. NPDC051170 TaxID=3364056 RepID=UPI0037B30D9C
MAQGYPPPQQQYYGQQPQPYPQHPQQPQQPYGYGPNPYAPQPQQPQPYPQQPQQPYGQNPYPPQQYAQPQQPYPPQQYAGPERPKCPEEAYAGRRFLAIVLDFALALTLGFSAAMATEKAREAHPVAHAVGHAATHHSGLGVVPFWAAFVGVGLLASFVNQVLLARLTGFSLGKGVLAMRVVRSEDVSRPRTWRLSLRWLVGFVLLALSFLSEEFDLWEGDVVGMRAVRWKHLREYEQAVARLG